MSIVKGSPADISPDFLEKLMRAFPEKAAIWRQGDDLADCAHKAGGQEVIRWIIQHARLSVTHA